MGGSRLCIWIFQLDFQVAKLLEPNPKVSSRGSSEARDRNKQTEPASHCPFGSVGRWTKGFHLDVGLWKIQEILLVVVSIILETNLTLELYFDFDDFPL